MPTLNQRLLHFIPDFNSPEVKVFLLTIIHRHPKILYGHAEFISKVHSDNVHTSPMFLFTGINRIMTLTEKVMPKYFAPLD